MQWKKLAKTALLPWTSQKQCKLIFLLWKVCNLTEVMHLLIWSVVVPSPATSFVLTLTSFISCAPIFSNASSSSISFAMLTPSFVIRGAPYFLSKTTFLPFGPRVIFTACRLLIYLKNFWRYIYDYKTII